MQRVSISTVFLLIGIVLFLSGCSDLLNPSGPVSKSIGHEIRQKGIRLIDIAKLTSFEWDELYLFGPYALSEDMCKQLGIAHQECKSKLTASSTDDNEMVLVFRNKGQIVHVEKHSRFYGDFTPLNFTQPLTPSNAIFSAEPKGVATSGKTWYLLRPK